MSVNTDEVWEEREEISEVSAAPTDEPPSSLPSPILPPPPEQHLDQPSEPQLHPPTQNNNDVTPQLPNQQLARNPTPPLPGIAEADVMRNRILRECNLKIQNPQKRLGEDNVVEGDCDWMALTKEAKTTSIPPPPLEYPGGTFHIHPRRWHCSEKQANYRRLLSPTAMEFRNLAEAMIKWEPSK